MKAPLYESVINFLFLFNDVTQDFFAENIFSRQLRNYQTKWQTHRKWSIMCIQSNRDTWKRLGKHGRTRFNSRFIPCCKCLLSSFPICRNGTTLITHCCLLQVDSNFYKYIFRYYIKFKGINDNSQFNYDQYNQIQEKSINEAKAKLRQTRTEMVRVAHAGISLSLQYNTHL